MHFSPKPTENGDTTTGKGKTNPADEGQHLTPNRDLHKHPGWIRR